RLHSAYVGNDYPWKYDIAVGTAEMDFSETVRYALNEPASAAEWALLQMIPTHQGYVRLGAEKRLFLVGMFHSLHCMDMIRRGLLNYTDELADPPHVQHCMTYVRQLLLCGADDTLEPGDFATRNFSIRDGGSRHTRQCRDWSAVYRGVDENYQEWRAWR
ncbi:hypothetical protein PUNSTDRAFT_32734, partial [Punctularia strigosozonata HHB-11173 SS5]|uniref:uncharacterized protein n=1 Tax=Punctularia strigosozonata (strain HHB-11173) TaxID=741275 RepID=UPI00044166EC